MKAIILCICFLLFSENIFSQDDAVITIESIKEITSKTEMPLISTSLDDLLLDEYLDQIDEPNMQNFFITNYTEYNSNADITQTNLIFKSLATLETDGAKQNYIAKPISSSISYDEGLSFDTHNSILNITMETIFGLQKDAEIDKENFLNRILFPNLNQLKVDILEYELHYYYPLSRITYLGKMNISQIELISINNKICIKFETQFSIDSDEESNPKILGDGIYYYDIINNTYLYGSIDIDYAHSFTLKSRLDNSKTNIEILSFDNLTYVISNLINQ